MPENQETSINSTISNSSSSDTSTNNTEIVLPQPLQQSLQQPLQQSTPIIIPPSSAPIPLYQVSRRLVTVIPNQTHSIGSAFLPPAPPAPPTATPTSSRRSSVSDILAERERSPRPTVRTSSPGGQGHSIHRISATDAQRFLQPAATVKTCTFCTLPLHYCILCSARVHHTLLCCSQTTCGNCHRRGHVTGLCPNPIASERQNLH